VVRASKYKFGKGQNSAHSTVLILLPTNFSEKFFDIFNDYMPPVLGRLKNLSQLETGEEEHNYVYCKQSI
jgi:hypothetical protein